MKGYAANTSEADVQLDQSNVVVFVDIIAVLADLPIDEEVDPRDAESTMQVS